MDLKIKTIGIIGGGQLAMMLAQCAHKLGFKICVLEKSIDCPAYSVLDLKSDRFIIGELCDYSKLMELASCSDVLTFEIEHIDTKALAKLQYQTNKVIYPSPQTLELINDKFVQKTFLHNIGLPVGKFEPIEDIQHFDRLTRRYGFPFLIKSRTGGYDGGGNFIIKSKSDLELLIAKLDLLKTHQDYFVEKFVSFEREISVLLARSIDGEILSYPTIDTFQENSVCNQTIIPSDLNPQVQQKARQLAIKIAQKLQYVGVMAVEMFILQNGEVLINEIAPRVHNSGHWTLDGSSTSQFEQHIRCITGMSLGLVDNSQPFTLMYNVFGSHYRIISELKITPQPNISVYDYNKKQVRPNRKMGHINIVGNSHKQVIDILHSIKF